LEIELYMTAAVVERELEHVYLSDAAGSRVKCQLLG
jgi:hypothetical protein